MWLRDLDDMVKLRISKWEDYLGNLGGPDIVTREAGRSESGKDWNILSCQL